MEIREFVTNVLKDTIEATKAASDERYKFRVAYREGKGIYFDIAVVASEENEKNKGIKGGIKVAFVIAGEGEAGSKNKTITENISRIQFNVECVDTEPRSSQEISSIRKENSLR